MGCIKRYFNPTQQNHHALKLACEPTFIFISADTPGFRRERKRCLLWLNWSMIKLTPKGSVSTGTLNPIRYPVKGKSSLRT